MRTQQPKQFGANFRRGDPERWDNSNKSCSVLLEIGGTFLLKGEDK